MVRVTRKVRRSGAGWLLGAVAAAVLAVPAAPALADRDRDRGGYRDHGRSHGRGYGHDYARDHGRHCSPPRVSHHHHHHHHPVPRRSSSFSFHVGIDPFPAPVYVRERHIVVHRPAPVIVHRPAPRVVYVEPEPVYIPAPQPVYVLAPQPVYVRAQTAPIAPRPAVVSVPAVVEVRPVLSDTVPAELSVDAFRTGDTVVVLLSGRNTGGAFETSLAAGNLRNPSPVLVLRNVRVGESATDTEFTVNMSITVNQPVRTITVRVADQAYDVPVTVIQPGS